MNNLKDFILEIGKDFSYVGKEYRIQVGNRDFYIDLLFYNRAYSCLVAFELKIGEFEPEYLSKMNFILRHQIGKKEKKEKIQVQELFYALQKMKQLLNMPRQEAIRLQL